MMNECIFDEEKLELFPATKTSEGIERKFCPQCKATYTKLPALDGSSDDYWVIEKAEDGN